MARANKVTENNKYWIEFGIDLDKRKIMIDDEIEDVSMGMYLRALDKMIELSEDKPIEVIVNSYGGDIYSALMLVDKIESLPVEIRTVASGKAMSAALVIFMAGDIRQCTERARFMFHSVSHAVDGKVNETEIDVSEAKQLNNEMVNLLAKKSKRNAAWWKRRLAKENYFNKKEAFYHGITTEE